MKSLLNALQEGRLVELPVNDKDKVLEYLALLIEAIPDIGSSQDLVKEVKEREAISNTGIGYGVACPHVRSSNEGELLCAVGWSPEGIDYKSSDGKKVHLVVMYFIPDAHRNTYLKEVSGLAKAIIDSREILAFSDIKDIQSIRNKLLDWAEIAINKAVPDSISRMIKLEGKQAAISTPSLVEAAKSIVSVIPFSIVVLETGKFTALTDNQQLADILEKNEDLIKKLSSTKYFEQDNFYISVINHTVYSKNRSLYQCIGVKFSS